MAKCIGWAESYFECHLNIKNAEHAKNERICSRIIGSWSQKYMLESGVDEKRSLNSR